MKRSIIRSGNDLGECMSRQRGVKSREVGLIIPPNVFQQTNAAQVQSGTGSKLCFCFASFGAQWSAEIRHNKIDALERGNFQSSSLENDALTRDHSVFWQCDTF